MFSTPRYESNENTDLDANSSSTMGISRAIAKAITLQQRLQRAITETASVYCSADRSLASLNREREALLLVRDHLEMLENKLCDMRCMESRDLGSKDGNIHELDSYRRNLLQAGRGVLQTQLASKSKELIKEVLAFVEDDSPEMSPSPLELRSENRSPVSLSDLSETPLHQLPLHGNRPAGFTPLMERRTTYLPTTSYGKVQVRNYNAGSEDGHHIPAESMSELYADIRTSCAASRACSRAASMKNEDVISTRSGQLSCTNCGHAVVQSKATRRFRPWRWTRIVLTTGVAVAIGQSDWGRQKAVDLLHWYRARNAKSIGLECNTGSMLVANGVEGFPSEHALAVWPPPAIDAGRG